MRSIIIGLIFVLLSLSSSAVTNKSDVVNFGIYPVSIYDIDPANGSFGISFYAWWRTKNKNYHPESSIEIVNSRDYSYKFGNRGKYGDEYYTYVHYYAKIHQSWNSKYFPFGRQFLVVKLEDFSDLNSIIFDPDYKESKLHSEFSLPGWNIVSLSLKKSITDYATSFGVGNGTQSLYSRLSFIIEIKRNGWRLYVSYFIGFFMASVLVHLLYLMSAMALPARATIFIGAVFSFVGNKYILDQKMPPTDVFSLADAIQVATFIAMLVSIITIIMLELSNINVSRQRRISFLVGVISLTLYTSYIVSYTFIAVRS